MEGLAASSFLFADLSGTWMAISALEAPANMSIGIVISPGGVLLEFVSTGPASDLWLQHGSNMALPFYAGYESLETGGSDVPLDGSRGSGQNAMNMGPGSPPGMDMGDWQPFAGMPSSYGPFVFPGPAAVGVSAADQPDSAAAAQPLRGDLPISMDVFAAGAAHKFDNTIARDPAANASGGNATDVATFAAAPIAAQYEWPSSVNAADPASSSTTESGLVAIDFGSLPALRLTAAAPDSSASVTGDLDGCSLATVLSLAVQSGPLRATAAFRYRRRGCRCLTKLLRPATQRRPERRWTPRRAE